MTNETVLKYCEIIRKKLGITDRVPSVEDTIYNYHTKLK